MCYFAARTEFLEAFAKLRRAAISFAMSVRPSDRPQGTTLLQLDGFSLNLLLEYVPKICRENSIFIKIIQK